MGQDSFRELKNIILRQIHIRKEEMVVKKKIFVRPVSVNLSEEVFKQIYDIAEKEEISLSDYIREAIQEKLERANVKFGYESIY